MKTGIRKDYFEKYFQYNADEDVYEVETKKLFDMAISDSVDTGNEEEFFRILMRKFEELSRDLHVDDKFMIKLFKNYTNNLEVFETEKYIIKAMLNIMKEQSRW